MGVETGAVGGPSTVKFEVQDDVKADVLNVLPPMRAGAIAVQTGLANSNARWCGVNYLNFESTVARDIHVIGDSIQLAPLMPKSAHMANSHAKVTAAAIVAELAGWEINPAPMLTNTCYKLRRRQVGGARGQRSRIRGRRKDLQDGGRLGWLVGGAQRARRPLRLELGAHHLGRYPGVTVDLQLSQMIAADATISLNSAIDILPDTAYGLSSVVSEYFITNAGFRRDRLARPIDQPANRRSSTSS